MKIIILILGLVVVFLGLLPLLIEFLPESFKVVPSKGMTYHLLIALVGGLIAYLSLESKVKGNEKAFLKKVLKG